MNSRNEDKSETAVDETEMKNITDILIEEQSSDHRVTGRIDCWKFLNITFAAFRDCLLWPALQSSEKQDEDDTTDWVIVNVDNLDPCTIRQQPYIGGEVSVRIRQKEPEA